jgi:integrase
VIIAVLQDHGAAHDEPELLERQPTAREGVPLNIIQRQLGHANLGTTSIYLKGSTRRRSSRRCAHAARR